MDAYNMELAHLQLTWRCNLRCSFCGQWGKHGFAPEQTGRELETKEWFRAIDQINALNSKGSEKPAYIIWGGEPLLSPAFTSVVDYLSKCGCRSAIVTVAGDFKRTG